MILLYGIELIIGILLGVAYITLGERKILSSIQRRIGPNIVGYNGLLQPIIDGIKLLIKEILIPQQAIFIIYIIGPICTLILALIIWIYIPINNNRGILWENEYGIIYILTISSLSVFISLYSSWSSQSKYTYIGTIRSISQLISYEVSMGIIILNLIILSHSFNLLDFIYSQIYINYIIPLFPIFILFFISIVAETNRPPFDLSEAESELVAGVLTEYSSLSFAYLYLSEYTFIFSMSLLSSILFLGSSYYTPIFIFLYILIRGVLPRIRYDSLIKLGWVNILPFSITFLYLIYTLSIIF